MHARRSRDRARGEGDSVAVVGVFLGAVIVPCPGLQHGDGHGHERQVGLGALLDRVGVLSGQQFPRSGQVVAAPQHVAGHHPRPKLHRHPCGLLMRGHGAIDQIAVDAVPHDEAGQRTEGAQLRDQPLVAEPLRGLEGGQKVLDRLGAEVLGADPQQEAQIAVDQRAEGRAWFHLRERLADQRERGSAAFEVGGDPGPVVQRGGAQRPTTGQPDCLVQQLAGALGVERGQVEPARVGQPLDPGGRMAIRGEPQCQVGEFGPGDGGAPEAGVLGGRGEPGRQVPVRPRGGQGQVAHLALGRAGDRRQAPVGLLAPPLGGAGVVHRAEQRVREPDAVPGDLEHARRLGGFQPLLGILIVASRPAGWVVSRRCAYSRTAAVARSSHGRSSTPTITGAASVRARITPRKATATARWSGGSGPGSARSSATSSARCWGPGSPPSAASGTGSSRSPSAEKLSAASGWTGRQVSTCQPRRRAWSIPADHSVVLPMPGSPSISSAAGWLATASRNRPIRASSAARPGTPTTSSAERSAATATPPGSPRPGHPSVVIMGVKQGVCRHIRRGVPAGCRWRCGPGVRRQARCRQGPIRKTC